VATELRENKNAEQLRAFFTQWRDQIRDAGGCAQPNFCDDDPSVLTSRILSCRVTVESQNISPCTDVAEALLAALESLLATGQMRDLFAHEPDLTVRAKLVESTDFPFMFDKTDRNGKPHIEITCSKFNPHSLSVAQQNQIKDQLNLILMFIVARVFIMDDPKRTLTHLFRNERALERSLNFTSGFVTLGNVLGHQPKHTLSAWIDPKTKDYPLLRQEEWDNLDRQKRFELAVESKTPAMGSGEVPEELRNRQIKQSEMETVSLIRIPLWDKAKWRGAGFIVDPSGRQPPLLALLFEQGNVGVEIFSLWRQEMGSQDEKERLRVVIVRGISRQRPHSYRVIITANMSALAKSGIKQFGIVSRQLEMEPRSNQNLNMFIESYHRVGAYFLGHANLQTNTVFSLPTSAHFILKREITIRFAWEIGIHDPDSVAIHQDDDPIVPSDKIDVPVKGVLAALKRKSLNK
jgi:hypothetical protein